MDRRPSFLWRAFALGGVATLGAVSYNEQAWDTWKATVGESVPREALRSAFNVTVGLHVAEAAVARRKARKAGLEQPGRWALSTLLYGFPVLRRLGRASVAAIEARNVEALTPAA